LRGIRDCAGRFFRAYGAFGRWRIAGFVGLGGIKPKRARCIVPLQISVVEQICCEDRFGADGVVLAGLGGGGKLVLRFG
jgi:hypothetical protein